MTKYGKKENGKNDTGRPSKYDPEICDEMIVFFQRPLFEWKEIAQTNSRGEVYTVSKCIPNDLPTFEHFALKKKLSKNTLYDWASQRYSEEHEDIELRGKLIHPDFSDAFEICHDLQRWFLAQNALSGNYNPFFAKFVALNITEWKDEKKIDHTSGGEKITSFVYLPPNESDDKADSKAA